MKTLLALLMIALALQGTARERVLPTGAERRAKAIALAHALRAEKVPVFEVKELSVRETLALLEKEWRKKHPREPFPVELKFQEALEDELDNRLTGTLITLSLRDVPYVEALKYIANLANLDLRQKNGIMTLAPVGHGAAWSTRTFNIPPRVLASLNLNANSSEKEIKEELRRYEIELADWMRVRFLNSGKALVITTMEKQHEQIAALFHLLGRGFKIQK